MYFYALKSKRWKQRIDIRTKLYHIGGNRFHNAVETCPLTRDGSSCRAVERDNVDRMGDKMLIRARVVSFLLCSTLSKRSTTFSHSCSAIYFHRIMCTKIVRVRRRNCATLIISLRQTYRSDYNFIAICALFLSHFY